jgi:exodeoxyribonuclease V beta subunit
MLDTPAFDVLDRNLDVHCHHLLEASAGTGKTFSIENIVVRLLIENVPCPLDKILVMTFTRAAVRDLKLVKSIAALETREGAPDYLRKIIERGEEAILKAKNDLEHALFSFDQAQIFTIHGFCNRMLRQFVFEGGLKMDVKEGETPLPKELFRRGIHDFFRTGLTPTHYGKIQLIRLADAYRHDQADLENALCKILYRRGRVLSPESFRVHYTHFCQGMQALKEYSPDKVLADFYTLAPCLKNIETKAAESFEGTLKTFTALLSLSSWTEEQFEQVIKDSSILLALFDPEQRKKNKKFSPELLHYPHFYDALKTHLAAAQEAGDVGLITLRLAADCQNHIYKVLEEEECLGPDELLKAMQKAVLQPSFANQVRSTYRAVIVDEFQDTDPIQWEIFQTLFLHPQFEGHLTLVGDPKQSIYAFRQADIYTYMAAALALGPAAKATLDTNYRSQAPLIEALNTLFSAASHFMPLPRLGQSLPYHPVKAGAHIPPKQFHDAWGPLHFMRASSAKKFNRGDFGRAYLTFIAQEIRRLIALDHLSPREIAILVTDRHQAEQALKALTAWNIPAQQQRQAFLGNSPAVDLVKELLTAVLNPRNESALKIALGGPLLGWTHHDLQQLENEFFYESLLLAFNTLRTLLREEGFAPFFFRFLRTPLLSGDLSPEEKILQREGGLELYQDLLQLAEVLIAHQYATYTSPEGLIQYLKDLKCSTDEEEGALKKRIDTDQEAVQILTIHSSKGLEFEVVFALGLFVPSQTPELLIPDEKGELWKPVKTANEPPYIAFCQEQEAEKMRQLYVAMTRAKYRLYVPLVANETPSPSPIESFLQKLERPLESFLSPLITLSEVEESNELPAPLPSVPLQLIPPPKVELHPKRQFMLSYSSLTKGQQRDSKEASLLPPHDFLAELKTVHTLPSGSDVGNLLHTLLETVALDSPAHPGLGPLVQGTPFVSWKGVLQQLLDAALQTPLPLKTGPAPLQSLSPHKMYREIDFMFPWDDDLILPDIEKLPGFIKGVIDMVFEHKGIYYLADWKSNWLGPDPSFYTQAHLEKAMRENGYFLQAEVYREALKRYLALFDPRPFDEIFGGMFYIFLRGLDPKNNLGRGIYHDPKK